MTRVAAMMGAVLNIWAHMRILWNIVCPPLRVLLPQPIMIWFSCNL